jgi:PAS domain S-box-containing protein
MKRRIPVPEAEAARRQGSIDGLEAPGDICREAITASPFGVLVHDAGGRILLFNARLEQITGYAAGEIPDIAAWIHRIYPNEEYRRIVLDEPRSASLPAVIRLREAMITTRDGRTETCRFTSVRNESGLRIVFIQPVDEPANLAVLPAAGDPGYRFLYQSCPLPTLLWKRRAEGFCLISFNTAARKLLREELELSLGLPPVGVLASMAEFFECMQRCLADRPNEKSPPHRCGGPFRDLLWKPV